MHPKEGTRPEAVAHVVLGVSVAEQAELSTAAAPGRQHRTQGSIHSHKPPLRVVGRSIIDLQARDRLSEKPRVGAAARSAVDEI